MSDTIEIIEKIGRQIVKIQQSSNPKILQSFMKNCKDRADSLTGMIDYSEELASAFDAETIEEVQDKLRELWYLAKYGENWKERIEKSISKEPEIKVKVEKETLPDAKKKEVEKEPNEEIKEETKKESASKKKKYIKTKFEKKAQSIGAGMKNMMAQDNYVECHQLASELSSKIEKSIKNIIDTYLN